MNPPTSLTEELRSDERGLREAAERVLPPDGSELFLVIDQFEELFTLVEDEDRRSHFLANLLCAVNASNARVRIVVTLRADSYDRPLAYQWFGELLGARTQTVTPLSPRELERAVAGPAEQVGVVPEPALMAEIVADAVDRPGALPLLEYALTEIFERRRHGTLTLADYRELGGLGGALAGRAEHLYTTGQEGGQEATRQLFLRLVDVEKGLEAVRRRIRRSELETVGIDRGAMAAAIDGFQHHRLLTSDRDPVTREPTVEVAHEALFDSWERLRGWVEVAHDDLKTERRLGTEAADWETDGRDPSFLLRGSRLEQYEVWATESDIALGAVEREYLTASLRQRETEHRAEEQQRTREASLKRRSVVRLRGLVAALTVGALVAVSLALLAQDRGRRAEHETRIAMARELAAAAVSNLDVDSERSLLLALEAVETTYQADGTVLLEAEEVLHRALQEHRLVLTVPGYSGEFSADGSRLLTEGIQQGTAEVYDASRGERVTTAIGRGLPQSEYERPVLAFGPDGELFATMSLGGRGFLHVYDTSTGEEVWRRAGFCCNPFWLSPDGRFLAIRGGGGFDEDKTYLFDLRTGELVNNFNTAGSVAFSPNDSRMLIGDSRYDPGLKQWVAGYVMDRQQPGGGPPMTLLEHGRDVNGAAWSRDGSMLATSSPEKVILWDARTGEEMLSFSPPSGLFASLNFDPDSVRLATGMSDGTTIVWQLSADGARPVLTLAGHGGEVWTVSFNPDGTQLTTGSDDGTVKIWDITPEGSHEWFTVSGSGSVDFSPNGHLLATGSRDGDVRIYDATRGSTLLLLHGQRGKINGVDFAPDGSRLGSAGSDGTARIWDTASGDELLGVKGPAQVVSDIAFSPDGSMFATTSVQPGGQREGVTRIFDAATGDPLRTLPCCSEAENSAIGRSVDFSPDGRLLAGEGFRIAYVWRVEDGRILARMHQWDVRTVAFSPDGDRLLTGGFTRTVSVWDPRSGRQLDSLTGTFGQVTDLAFSPDGTTIATSSSDGTVKLWDARTLEEILTLATGAEGKLAFSPDGTRLAFTTDEGTVRVLALDIDDLVGLARSRLTRSWTEEECRTYLHLDRCPRTPD